MLIPRSLQTIIYIYKIHFTTTMAMATKVSFHTLNLSDPKNLLLLRKRYSRVKSIHIPMKGSSSLSDYSIESALKTTKTSSDLFKRLRKVKAQYISDGFLKFFAKNKQALKGMRSLSAGFGNLPAERTFQFSRFLNNMQFLEKIDDLAKFTVREVIKQRGFTFKPPHKLTSKPLGGQRAVKKGEHALCLKKVYPFRHVQKILFSPHLNVKRLFPSLKQTSIEVMFLNKLSELNKTKLTELVITDLKNIGLPPQPDWAALEKIQSLRNVTLRLTDPESADLLKTISNLPKRQLNLSIDLDILTLNEESVSLMNLGKI